jgi:hypothetical protein
VGTSAIVSLPTAMTSVDAPSIRAADNGSSCPICWLRLEKASPLTLLGSGMLISNQSPLIALASHGILI